MHPSRLGVALCWLLVSFIALRSEAQLDSTSRTKVTVYPDRVAIAPGGRARIAVILDHDEGWHTYTHDGDLPDELIKLGVEPIPTTVAVESSSPSLRIHSDHIQWPTPHTAQSGGLTYDAYTGRAIIYIPVSVPADASYGNVTVSVQTTFQACDESMCLQPADVQNSLQFTVTTSDQSQQPAPEAEHIFAGFDDSVWASIYTGSSDVTNGGSSSGLGLIWIIVGAGIVLVIIAIIGAKMALSR